MSRPKGTVGMDFADVVEELTRIREETRERYAWESAGEASPVRQEKLRRACERRLGAIAEALKAIRGTG